MSQIDYLINKNYFKNTCNKQRIIITLNKMERVIIFKYNVAYT